MKNRIPLLTCFILLFNFSKAQSPQYIPYQAVARNAAGNLLVNQAVSLRFTIHETSGTGTVDYEETQSATTNNLGLFSVNIGSGILVGTSPAFSSIPWGNGVAKFTQVEMDPLGGTAYATIGTTQLMSVPYALFAGSAGSASNAITSLNGLTGTAYPTQTFGIGTTGTAPSFSSVTGTHTLEIPMASAAAVTAGLLSNNDYTTFSNKVSGTSTINFVPHWTATSSTTGNLSSTSLISDNGTSVAIGNTSPSASAILDLTNSSGLGFLAPGMATRPASPTPGLIIYNTANNCLEFYSSNAWQSLSCPCSAAPSVPGAITGTSTNLCVGSSNTYSILPVAGATSYVWTAPAGCNIVVGGTSYGTSYTGTYTSVSVTMGSTTGSNLTVKASNSCGTSAANTGLTLNLVPASISWTSDPTIVGINQSSVVYSIAPVTGATNYQWSLSGGSTTSTTLSGSSDNSITVTFANGTLKTTLATNTSTTTNISVTATTCGVVATGSIAVVSGGHQAYTYTGANQQWPLAANVSTTDVTSVYVKLWGAGGGGAGAFNGNWAGPGGGGGYVAGNLSVTAGGAYAIIVGQGGTSNETNQSTMYGGGGGSSGNGSGWDANGAGGGRSAIQTNNTSGIDNVVAGGGGGGAEGQWCGGGYGGSNGSGGTSNGNNNNSNTPGSGGGTSGGGAAGNGNNCSGAAGGTGNQWQGGTGCNNKWAGGGGGGWWGGGGGAGNNGPGGGGSGSLGTLTNTSYQNGSFDNVNTNGTASSAVQPSGGTSDPDYNSSYGFGQANTGSVQYPASGGNGYVIIFW